MSTAAKDDITAKTIKRWKNKRGSLIMALHQIQDQKGYVPRETAFDLARSLNVPLARIYEVLTFYNYFKLTPPGKAVISVCTGTACHLKGASKLVDELKRILSIEAGETTGDGLFHLQTVRCVGCCGLAPVIVVNGKTYGKVKLEQIHQIIGEWREYFEKGEQ
jgi:NADH-quinone oxidoreductase subunit E